MPWPDNSPLTLAVESALDSTAQSAHDIWRKIGCWSPSSVRYALRNLVAVGRARQAEQTAMRGNSVTYYYVKV